MSAPKRVISIYLEDEVIDAITQYAKQEKRSRTKEIEIAILEKLEKVEINNITDITE